MRKFGGIGIAWAVATFVAVVIAAAAVGSVRSEVTNAPTALGVAVSPSISISTPPSTSSAPEPETTLSPSSATTTTQPDGSAPATTATADSTNATTRESVLVETAPQPPPSREKTPLPVSGSAPPTTDAPEDPPDTTSDTTTATTTTTTQPPRTTTTTTMPPPPTTTTTTVAPTTTTAATTAYVRVIDTDGGSMSLRVNGDSVMFGRAWPKGGWRFDLREDRPELVEGQFTMIDDRSMRIRVSATVVNGVLEVSVGSSK